MAAEYPRTQAKAADKISTELLKNVKDHSRVPDVIEDLEVTNVAAGMIHSISTAKWRADKFETLKKIHNESEKVV